MRRLRLKRKQRDQTCWGGTQVLRFTFGYLGFLRSFQGPLGQTHTHKPRKGVRGRVKGVNRDMSIANHNNRMRTYMLDVSMSMNMQTPPSSTVDRSMAAGCTSNKGHADTTAGQFTVIGGSTDWSRKDPARHRPLAAVRPVHGLQRARVPDWLLRVHSAMLSSWRSREMQIGFFEFIRPCSARGDRARCVASPWPSPLGAARV